MDLREAIYEQLTLTISLAEEFVVKYKQHETISGEDERDLLYKATLIFFFCKAYKTYQALSLLWEKGFAEDAAILSRSIFESSLQAMYMSNDPKIRASEYHEHVHYELYDHYLKLKKLSDPNLVGMIRAIENNPEKLNFYKSEHQRLTAEYKNKGRKRIEKWWGDSIYGLAKQMGQQTESDYGTLYWLLSNLVHTGSVSVQSYASEIDDKLTIDCYPDDSDDPLYPQKATQYFLNIIRLTSEGIGEEPSRDSLQKLMDNAKLINELMGGEETNEQQASV